MAVALQNTITVPHDQDSECYICLDKGFSEANPAKSHTGAHASHKYVCHEACLMTGPLDRIKCACGAFFSRIPVVNEAPPLPTTLSGMVRQVGAGVGGMIGGVVGGLIGKGIQQIANPTNRALPIAENAPIGERIGAGIGNYLNSHRWTITGSFTGAKIGSAIGSALMIPLSIAVREIESARGEAAKAAVFGGAIAGAFLMPQFIAFEYALANDVLYNSGCAIGACAVGAAARFFGWR
jgi:hypothetical protein